MLLEWYDFRITRSRDSDVATFSVPTLISMMLSKINTVASLGVVSFSSSDKIQHEFQVFIDLEYYRTCLRRASEALTVVRAL